MTIRVGPGPAEVPDPKRAERPTTGPLPNGAGVGAGGS
jgi:hypothetical protein